MIHLNKTTTLGLALALLGTITTARADISWISTAFTDTYVDAAKPTENFGGYGAMQVSGANETVSYRTAFIMFDVAAAIAAFDAEYGVGNWKLDSASLDLTTNYGTAGVQPGNNRFSKIAAGDFDVWFFDDDTWTDGSSGLTYNSYLSDYADTDTTLLGSYTWAADGNGTTTYTLSFLDSLLTDLLTDSASLLSLQITPSDDVVSYLFNTTNNSPAQLTLIASAVPEPAHYALALALPLLLLGVIRRRAARASRSL
ncbi:MAG: hypothetical protein Q7Q73_12280 [Verrucomicrobiota bacterium JB024]|nr:hypothetical protein [Verrucomicrobiota bacterium JB024]